MSKAILILDEMPTSCGTCDMFYADKYFKCYRCKAHYDETLGDESVVQSWCPLKPVPQKNKYDVEKYACVVYEDDITLGHFLNIGWNDCIDEILGGEEERS